MKRSPLVSVIIPTYNRASRLVEALQSVLSQDFADYDVWIVDDGSTDDTGEAVRPFLSERVRVIHKTNGGLSSARNAGIRASSGEYVALLDDDDLCLPGRLRKQAEFLNAAPDVGLHFSDVWRVDRAGHRCRFTPMARVFSEMARRNTQDGKYIIRSGEMLRSLLVEKPLKPSAVMMRRRCFEQVGLFDEKLGPGEMLELLLRLSRADITFGYTDEPLVEYRIWGGNIGVASRARAPRLAIRILEENRRLARLAPEQNRWAQAGIAYQYSVLGLLLKEDRDVLGASAAFAKALQRDFRLRYLAQLIGCWLPHRFIDAAARIVRNSSTAPTCGILN